MLALLFLSFIQIILLILYRMEQINTEVLIIGFGQGGKVLAGHMGKMGVETVLVEQSEKMYGGTCINIGCIPTKSLVEQAERGIPYPEAIAAKDDLTAFMREKNYDAVADFSSVRVIDGKASFLSPHRVKVSKPGSPDVIIQAERICINTGTVPVIPSITGLEQSSRVYSSTTLIDQKVLPEKLIIIGGGFIGLEFASMYAQYGSRVTILESLSSFLPKEDEDIVDELKKVLEQKGIEILTGVKLQGIEPGEKADTVVFEREGERHEFSANAILLATGRKAYTDGLDLKAAGVISNDRGFIPSKRMVTDQSPHIWALGDINGGPSSPIFPWTTTASCGTNGLEESLEKPLTGKIFHSAFLSLRPWRT
jgi:pyruvate/2-oxoglutarate dehydrogenase complex dihydrolipoamide dehydrogenase (E3) component